MVAGEVRVIELEHRQAGELLPVLESMLGSSGAVSALDNRLIVRASTKDAAALEKLVAQLDTPRAMLRIAVRQEMSSAAVGRGGGTLLSTSPGRVGIEEGGRTLGNRSRSTEQFVQVLDGETALIEVGERRPYARIRAYVGGHRRGVVEVTDFQDLAEGFLVRPNLQGEGVVLDISPYQSMSEDTGAIDFSQLATRVEAPFDEWIDLGGHLEGNSVGDKAGNVLRAGGDQRHLWIKISR
ncbi:MAG: secretin N-terminal domain-containing protein [Trichloromonas sp.]|nr:secretin N-terminal domain-containing protein [Trichloromonas sp.]